MDVNPMAKTGKQPLGMSAVAAGTVSQTSASTQPPFQQEGHDDALCLGINMNSESYVQQS